MSQLRHTGPRHIHVPDRKEMQANWNEIEKFSRGTSNYPFCAMLTGDPGTIASGTPGAASYVTWTANANPLYDLYRMIVGDTTIRIPSDGFYDFYLDWLIANNSVVVDTEISTFMDTANTSITGYGAVAWTRAVTAPGKFIPANQHIGLSFFASYAGIELHANDLVRFGIQVYSANNLTATVPVARFALESPIPVDR